MLTKLRDWPGASSLCSSALEQLEQLHPVQQPDWAADWVWLSVEQARLEQQVSGAAAAEHSLRSLLQSLLPAMPQHAAHPHLVSYCHLSLARLLLQKADDEAVKEADELISKALLRAQEEAECRSVWLPDGVIPQSGQQRALRALCLLARLEQVAAGWRLDPPIKADTGEGDAAAEACSEVFGYTSPQAKKVGHCQ